MGPSISGLVPTSVAANSGSFTLRVNGSNFCDGSAVNFDGQPLETTFVAGGPFGSPGFLTAFVEGSRILAEGSAAITVVNQGEISCALGMSQPATLTIDPAGGGMAGDPPEITLITPDTVQAGGPSFTLRVDGPHFCPASTIRFNGVPQRTTLHGAGQIVSTNIFVTADIDASLIADAGMAAITIQNPIGGPGCTGDGVSNELLLAIAGPAIVISDDLPPRGVIGDPYSFNLMAIGGTPPFDFTVVSGSLPPGLTLSSGGAVSGLPTAAGTFTWTALVSDALVQTAVREFSIQVEQDPTEPADIVVPLQPLTFSFSGGSVPKRKVVGITNAGGQSAAIGISTRTDDGAAWLSASPSMGNATASNPLNVVVTADPTGLPPGAYFGEVLVDTGMAPAQGPPPSAIPVSMTISERQKFLRLSLEGLTFTAVNTGDPPQPLSFDIFNDGGEALTASLTADTFPAGVGWLSLPVSEFSVEPGSRASQPRGAGIWGPPRIRRNSLSWSFRRRPPAARHLQHLARGLTSAASRGAQRDPHSDRRRRDPCATNANHCQLATPRFRTQHLPKCTALRGPRSVRQLSIERSNSAGRPDRDGDYDRHQWPQRGRYPDAAGAEIRRRQPGHRAFDGHHRARRYGEPKGTKRAGRLSATRLIPLVESFSGGLQAYAGSPGFIRVRVSDDCGGSFLGGPSNEVRVDLAGSGEPALFLSHVENGRWDATITAGLSADVVVNVTATDGARGITGQTTTAVTVEEAIADPPAIFADGIRQAASFASQPLAPGSFVTIFGSELSSPASNLGEGAVAVPLPETLADASVFVAGFTPAPMVFALGSQLNIILPFEQDPNAGPIDVLILRGATPSAPFELQIAAAEPGIFTIGSAGVGEAVVQDAAFQLVSRQIPGARPAVSPGDVVIIYATGLGAVTPEVASGTASPSNPLATVAGEVRVEIGGVNAAIGFAGLTPNFVSLYQLNVVIPPGLAPGDAEVVIFVGGRPSPSGVTLAIE